MCIDYDADEDDGVIKHKSTYTTSAPAEDVRRFYEDVFARQGWAVLEFSSDIEDGAWEYEIAQSQRQLKVKVDAEVTLSGTITEIKLEDK